MILGEFALLASDTARSKAYLHAMCSENKLPGLCIVYSDDIAAMKKESEQYEEIYSYEDIHEKYFDVDKPVLSFLEEAGIDYILVNTKDINSEEMKDILQGLEQKYLIYSGYGGYILKPHLFRMGKKFIHVHAGLLPQYRGSTTAYYSVLQDGFFGATAIFLNEGIDEGEIITQEIFFGGGEKQVDIDYVYEPYIRSRVLIKALNQYLENGRLTGQSQEQKDAQTYFIIHPVLKHLAMLCIEQS